MKTNKTIRLIFLFSLILLIPTALLASRWRYSGYSSNNCFSNMRKIQGAIEEYNANAEKNGKKKITFMPPAKADLVLYELCAGNYLPNIPYCVYNKHTTYYGVGDLSKDGHLVCIKHGAQDIYKDYEKTKNAANLYSERYYHLDELFFMSIATGIGITAFIFIGVKIAESMAKEKQQSVSA